jgi:hypothetical protein
MAMDLADDDFGFRVRCEERANKVFKRLHSLVQAGYVPDFHSEFVEAFFLSHPSNKFKHNRLIIYPSGLVVSLSHDEKFRFYLDGEDEVQFKRFLRQIPRPTWWDRSRDRRESIMGYVLVWGGFLLFAWIADWVLKSIGRSFGII